MRGEEIAYVPQDPASALNPSIRIGKQIVELMELRGLGTAESRLQGARDGLAEVGLPNDDEFLSRYAHQLSGGQVQRVALAMAFLPKPKVLVLDEPTTGLDVTTQAMVLQTMAELCRTHGVSALYVTHDLAVVANIADRVAVMYAGQIVELGPRDEIFAQPVAPLHARLARLDPAPEPGPRAHRHPRPDAGPGARPSGCRFHDRCAFAIDECRQRGARAARDRAGPRRALHPGRARSARWDISRGTVPDADPDKPREVILVVEGLDVFYGQQARRPRRQLRPRQGRGGRAGGRVRQRQDHDLAVDRRPAQGLDGHDQLRGRRARRRAPASAARSTASGCSTSSRTPTSR